MRVRVLLLFLVFLVLGCIGKVPVYEKQVQQKEFEAKKVESYIIKLDGCLDDWKNLSISPILTERKWSDIPNSANPQLVYMCADGEFIYISLKLYGQILEDYTYLFTFYNPETKDLLRIKWDSVEKRFETEYLIDDKYIKNIDTYGVKSFNILEIASKSYNIVKNCDKAELIVVYKGEQQYAKSLISGVKIDEIIPKFKIRLKEVKTAKTGVAKLREEAIVLHMKAWNTTVENAKSDNYFKYGIYASRILAVRHPEIYLQADKLFISKISSLGGFQKAYETRNVHSDYLMGRNMVGKPFSFDLVDFDRYNLIPSLAIYPKDYPVFGYLDRRMLPVATTLKTFDERITELEKIEQYYLASKSTKKYIIYCDNDRAYLWIDGKIINANLSEVKEIDGNPILIFNEKHVWYPLMDRNDTKLDNTFRAIVKKLSTSTKLPEVTDFERRMIEKLKLVTELNDNKQKRLAVLASIRAGIIYFEEEWAKALPEFKCSKEVYHSIMKEIIKDGNYLSPITSHLATILNHYQGEAGLEKMIKEYLTHSSIDGHKAHGHLWRCTMLEYLIEDSYRAKTGHCVTQAANLMAVLNLAGVDCYRLSALKPHGHDWLYVPKYDVVLSNGRVEKSGSVLCEQRILRFISHDDKWAYFFPYDFYAGTLPPNQTVEILQYLKSVHNEDFYGGVKIESELKEVDFKKLVSSIARKNQAWQVLKL